MEGLYIPDLLAIASFYPEWTTYGGGLGNYMAYGDIPQNGVNDPSKFKFPRGIILNKNLGEVLPLDPSDTNQIQEEVAHSWYKYPNGTKGLHPSEGITEVNYTGPKPPFAQLDENAGYSFVKAPRWKEHAMEVGPLARMLVGFASGRDEYKEVVTDALGRLKLQPAALVLDAGPHGRARTGDQAGRQVAARRVRPLDRQLEGGRLRHRRHQALGSENLAGRLQRLRSPKRRRAERWATGSISKTRRSPIIRSWCRALGTHRPRMARDKRALMKSALLGTPMADPKRPLEILRTIHSFDPCLACATHVTSPEGETLAEVIVR